MVSLPVLERERQQWSAEQKNERCRSRAAVAAVGQAVTRGWTRHVGAAAGHDRNRLGHAPHHQAFTAARRRRRLQELAARQHSESSLPPFTANQLLDLVVVGRELRVVDRPGDLPAIPSDAFKSICE